MDTKAIESSLKSISQSSVRTSNYLDGCQIAAFDYLNIIAQQTLKNDLLSVVGRDMENVQSRETTIENIKNYK